MHASVEAGPALAQKLHRLGGDPVVATLHVANAETRLEIAASAAQRQALLVPFEAVGVAVPATHSVGALINGR
jgi:hypothetical protein